MYDVTNSLLIFIFSILSLAEQKAVGRDDRSVTLKRQVGPLIYLSQWLLRAILVQVRLLL